MGTLAGCIGKMGNKAIPKEDADLLRSAQSEYQSSGMTATDAGALAVDELIASELDGLRPLLEKIVERGGAVPDTIMAFYGKAEPVAGDQAAADEAKGRAIKTAKRAWGKRVIDSMVDKGILNFVTSSEVAELGIDGLNSSKDVKDNQVKGIYYGGKAYVVVDVATGKEIAGVILHEVGVHFGLPKMLGDAEFKSLLEDMSQSKESDASIRKAYERVPGDTNPKHVNEEALAYLAEANPNHSIVQRMVEGIKKFLRRLGVPVNVLSDNASLIRDMAIAAMRQAAGADAKAPTTITARAGALFHRAWHGTPHTWEGDNGDAPALKDGGDGLVRNAELLREVSESTAFRVKGFGGLEVPRQRMVLAAMRAVLKNLKVRQAVVKAIPIDVVDVLSGGKLSADALLNDPSVFLDLFSSNGDKPVAAGIDGASAAVGVVASAAAKQVSAIGASRLPEFGAALGTQSMDDGHTSDSPTDFDDKLVEVRAKYSKPDQSKTPPTPRKELRQNEREWTASLPKKDAPKFSKAPQTDSLPFRLWFGKSKVVDKAGKPLVVYHGTASDFWTFAQGKNDATGHATSPLGFYFTPKRDQAQRYAENASEGVPADERVIDVYLAIRNPYEMTVAEAQAIESQEDARKLRAKLEAAGHDGIYITGADSWVAFKPSTIKSASENTGAFDPNNDDIRYSKGPDDAANDEDGERSTSTKNAVMDAEREAAGKDPIIRAAAKSNETTLANARAALDANPSLGEEVVERLRNTTTASISLEDEAVLLVEKVTLRNARDKAAARASDKDATEAQRVVAKRQWEDYEARINAIDQATYESGKEWGRLGQFRQRMLREDFTFEALERKERVREGRPLTQDESDKIRVYADRIKELEANAAAAKAAAEDATVKAVSEFTYKQLVKELAAAFAGEAKKGRPVLESLKQSADEARERLRKRAGNLNAGVDPAAFIDLARIGAYHVANGAVKLADWLAKMKADIGESMFGNVGKDIEDVFDAAKIMHQAAERATAEANAEPATDAKEAAAPKRKPKGEAKPADVLADIDGGKLTHQDVYDLARAHILAGVRGEGPVMAAVTADLQPIVEGITERDVRRMFSQYGEAKFPSQEADKVALRELRTLVRMQESIDRLKEGLDALKTGPQRDKTTQEIREKQQLLNDLLKDRSKNAVASPEKLASFQQARATNLRNQIAALNKQIVTGEVMQRAKAPPPNDEVKALTAERDALRKTRDEMLKAKRPVKSADQTYLEQREKALAKQIEALDARIKGEPAPAKPGPKPVNAETLRLEGMRDDLRKQLDAIEKAKRPVKSADDRYQQTRAKSLAKMLEDVRERLATGNYARKPKPETKVLNAANTEAAFELAKAKAEFARKQFEAEMAKRSNLKKALGGVKEAFNLSRAIMTSLDLSAVLRQGGFIALGHPLRALKGFAPMIKAFWSEQQQFKANDEIVNRPNFPLYKKAGLELTEHHTHLPSKMEEQFMSRWVDAIPKLLGGGLVRGSNRAFSTFLNKLRADSFDAMYAALGTGTNDLAEAKAIASYINVATGRGKLGSRGYSGTELNTVFFAPRLVASRFNLLFGQPMYGGTWRTRGMVAKEYARFLTGVGAVIGLAMLAREDDDESPFIETDPRSVNFMKMRFRNTFIDPLTGIAQVTVFMAQEAAGEKITQKGDLRPLRNVYRLSNMFSEVPDYKKVGFGQDTGFSILARFARTKLAPVPGAIVNAITGTDVVGNPVTAAGQMQSLLTPLSLRNVKDVMEEQGVARGTAISLLELLGMGVQYRDPNMYAKRKQAEKDKAMMARN